MSERNHRDIECPHCHATIETQDIHIVVSRTDGSTARIRHTEDCVDYVAPPAHPAEGDGPGRKPTYLRPVRPGEETTP